ncbi:MAG TPA: SRPBCC domain-containing protein [Candidatus Limnocylindria bacterium]|nr:SRPBCC domain-containing protein [Candidatus Limnocylindria bacterium]
MTEPIRDTATIAASAEAIWAILHDPAALARVLPGVESLEPDGPDRYRGVLVAKAGFFTVRADVTASLLDADPPRHVRLELAGRVRSIGGDFVASVPLDLTPLEDGRTRVDYGVDVQLGGQLARMGGSRIGDGLRNQVADLIGNVEREVAAGSAGG